MAHESQKDFSRLTTTSSNRKNHCRKSSVDSEQSEDGYDTLNIMIRPIVKLNYHNVGAE